MKTQHDEEFTIKISWWSLVLVKLPFVEPTHYVSFPENFSIFCGNLEVANIIMRKMSYCLDKRRAKVGAHGQHSPLTINKWCVL